MSSVTDEMLTRSSHGCIIHVTDPLRFHLIVLYLTDQNRTCLKLSWDRIDIRVIKEVWLHRERTGVNMVLGHFYD